MTNCITQPYKRHHSSPLQTKSSPELEVGSWVDILKPTSHQGLPPKRYKFPSTYGPLHIQEKKVLEPEGSFLTKDSGPGRREQKHT